MTPATLAVLKALVAFAADHSGLPNLDGLPAVVFASDCKINQVSADVATPCYKLKDRPALATYDDVTGIIYLPKYCAGLPKARDCRGIAVHELVHWLQDQRGMIDRARRNGCLAAVEPQAYRTANAYASRYGGLMVGDIEIMLASQCPTRY